METCSALVGPFVTTSVTAEGANIDSPFVQVKACTLGGTIMKIIQAALASALLLLAFTGTTMAQADRDCSDFSSQEEAQEFYERNGPGDPHRLDRDKDGIACERN